AGSTAIAGWQWTFGDGTHAAGGGGTHVYASGGSYSVTLTVTDADGLIASATRTVAVQAPNIAPSAAFEPTCFDLRCTFTDRSTDVDGTIVLRSWRIGGSAAGT